MRGSASSTAICCLASLFIDETISRLNPHYVLGSPEERWTAAVPGLDETLSVLLAVTT